MRRLIGRGTKRALWLGFPLYALCYIAITRLPISSGEKALATGVMYVFPALLAIAGCLSVFGSVKRNEKLFWLSLAAAVLIFLVSDISWQHSGLLTGFKEPPYTPIISSLYIIGYAFLIAVPLSMTTLQNVLTLTKLKYLLDICAVVITAFVLVWSLLLRPLFLFNPDITFFEKFIYSTIPLIDMGIILMIVINLSGFKASEWRVWEVLVAIGLAFHAIGDFGFNFFWITNSYRPDDLWSSALDVAWLSASFLYLMAAVYRKEARAAKPSQRRGPLSKSNLEWQDIGIPVFSLVAVPLFVYLAHMNRNSAFDYWAFLGSGMLLAMIAVVRSAFVTLENSRLFQHSVIDSVTGLFNHRFSQERLSIELARANRHREVLSLAIIDLDDFGQTNNIFGHVVGDLVLRKAAQKVKTCSRITDTVCRIGGDEFGVIMPQTSPVEAYKVCLRILEEIKNDGYGKGVQVSASIGIASFPIHAEEKEELIRKADGALYWAKFHGKDQVMIFDDEVVQALDAEERIKRVEEQSYINTVNALAAAVDARDPYTQNHSKHVAELAVMLATRLGLERENIDLIEMAAMLHDIGKIGIPDGILRKPGPLSSEEREQIEVHPILGNKILSSTTMIDILPWILAHHERWDGAGYPQGLKGDSIPLEARILAVCDAYDAMTSDRPYRSGLPEKIAIEEIRKGSGNQFDPYVVEVFVEALEEKLALKA